MQVYLQLYPVTKTIILWWILKTPANAYSCYNICKTFVRDKKKIWRCSKIIDDQPVVILLYLPIKCPIFLPPTPTQNIFQGVSNWAALGSYFTSYWHNILKSVFRNSGETKTRHLRVNIVPIRYIIIQREKYWTRISTSRGLTADSFGDLFFTAHTK